MRPVLFSLLLNALLIFLMLVLIQRKQIFAKPALLALFFGVYFLDNLAITLTNHFSGLQIVPNQVEELIYRGFLLAVINKLMPRKFKLFAAPVGWGVIVASVEFGLLHGVWLDSSLAIHLDMIALRNSTVSGFIFAWLRERIGRLLVPIVVHDLEDVLFFLPRMMQISKVNQ